MGWFTNSDQVLLTRSGFLAEKLRSYTRNLIESLSPNSHKSESPQQTDHPFLMTGDEDSDKDSVLTLRDESFPLVCTWDHFLRILENTIRIWHRQDFSELVGQFIDFYTFKTEYWPHFSHGLTKEFSVHLVFAEIMGVIKGSASSAESLAPLGRKDYLTRSCRMAPTFATEAERSRVYDLFESYETRKVSRGDMDYVDRAVRILRAMRQDPSLTKAFGSKFEEVYIDEIQDQRCLDIELLLSIVKDPRGFHFAGDTAQAISQDSALRFSDIKGMFYQHFAAVSKSTGQSNLARIELFTLSKNYRSHQGILSVASLVMGMIWQGFPETIDKLEPEIGMLRGPRPVLFIGVDSSLLHSSNAGHATLSAGTADFGAEQAIIVRDSNMKTALQNLIGEIALVFTVLESKGMEFNDVILWNLFTDCPDQAGLRSLETLGNDPVKFDARKHWGMCSELKNLYVAITRARNQLFMVEGSEKTAATVLKLLAPGPSQALIDVTRPGQGDFAMRLESLRPDSSVNPIGWRRRGDDCMHQREYKMALRCFRKAGYTQGVTAAEGHLCEAAGNACSPDTDPEKFTRSLGAAVEHFLKAELIGDAARVLVKMSKLEDAAKLWSEHNNYAKAARLFAQAGLYVKAFESHHSAREYSEAAALLQKEQDYDRLVSYLDDNRDNIPANTLQNYSLLCKLLLKRKRISPECRKHAINVLGSSAEQEACFIEYGMDEELANLYSGQQRHKDLFYLCSMKGKLERALSLAITKGLLESSNDSLESEVLSLLDYVWAGRVEEIDQQRSAVLLKLPSGLLTSKISLKAEQWEASSLAYSLESSIARQHVASMEVTTPKTVLCLRKILDVTAINQLKRFDDIPFEMMREAIRFAKDLVVNESSDALRILLLLTGLWKSGVTQDQYVLLSWSPIRGIATAISVVDAPKVARKWFLDSLVSAVLAMDAVARELWKSKWPIRCVHFSTTGSCPRLRNREDCHWLHQLVSRQESSQVVGDLLRVNNVFCDLAVMYYHRVLNQTFLETYRGIKRHWLERLLRELTHLSAVEQQTSAITKTKAELCHDKQYIAITSSLEELLYFRLVNEWRERSNFTSLLEQMQLAQTFGPNLQNRVFRALSYRLHRDGRGLLQNHLGFLNSLNHGLSSQNASAFQSNLNIFLRNLDNIDVESLSTLHALTAVFEYLAAYMILKTCVTACVLTQAWIDLHVPQFADAIYSVEPLDRFAWNYKYQQCLMELTKTFCGILRRFNQVPLLGVTLLCSRKNHHSLLLRQRNAELVAIVVANLAPPSPKGINELWTIAQEVFGYDFVRAYHLRSSTPAGVIPKLVGSFLKYNGKDALTLVIKDRSRGSQLFSLENNPGVKTASFDHICPRPASPVAILASAETSPSMPTDNSQEEYTLAETEAVIKFQRLWRSCSRKIKDRRSYMQLPEARAIAHFISLGAECPVTLNFIERVAFKNELVSNGTVLVLKLAAARDVLFKLQKDAMTCVENVEISTGLFETVDDVLHRNNQVEESLRIADAKMSDESLGGVVKTGVLTALEEAMKDIEGLVTKAEEIMSKTKKMVDAVSRNCT